MTSPTWSYSSLKTFQQCPKKYFHLKVAKDIKDTPGQAALYGSAVHKAAEDHVRDGKPIPNKYGYMEPILDSLKKIKGIFHCELELGITKDLQPCAFDAPDFWWHGIIDLLVIDEDTGIAHMIDYKTGKNARYADTKQLDYMAVAVFSHFPKITMIKSALLFVVSGEFIKKKHVATEKQAYIASALPDLQRLESAMDSGVWNPISGPLCRFCPVTVCEHHRS